MNYKVVHTEMYVPDEITNVYDINSFIERYPINKHSYCSLSELPKVVGETVTMQYDQYIKLTVTAL